MALVHLDLNSLVVDQVVSKLVVVVGQCPAVEPVVVLAVQMTKMLLDTQLAVVLKVLMEVTCNSGLMAMSVASVVDLVVHVVLLGMTVDSVDSKDHEEELVVLLEVLIDRPEDSEDRPKVRSCLLREVPEPLVTKLFLHL